MMPNKKLLKKRAKRLRKICSILYRLQKLDYNSSYVVLEDLINEADMNLALLGIDWDLQCTTIYGVLRWNKKRKQKMEAQKCLKK